MLKTLALGAGLAFMASGAFACDTVTSKVVPISFCVDAAIWTPDKATPPQEFVYFDKEQNIGFAVVTELGNANEADYRTAILNNAGGGAAKLMGERTETIGGQDWHVLEYSTAVNGTTLDYQNFYLVNPGVGGVQMVFFSTEADLTKAAVRAGMILGSVQFTH
jgi:hypothetical protein